MLTENFGLCSRLLVQGAPVALCLLAAAYLALVLSWRRVSLRLRAGEALNTEIHSRRKQPSVGQR